MKNFIEFLEEQVDKYKPKSNLKDIDHLPIHHSHDGIKSMADMFDGIHKKLLGKSTATEISYFSNGKHIAIKSDPALYAPADQLKYLTHKDNATKAYVNMKPEALDHVSKHKSELIPHMSKSKGPLTPEGYLDHLKKTHEKKIKSDPDNIEKHNKSHTEKSSHVLKNKAHFKKTFEMHDHLSKAKKSLINVLNKHVKGLPNDYKEFYVNHKGENVRLK